MEKKYATKFETKINTGSLHVTKAKTNPKSPDYFGEILIDLNSIEHDGNTVKVKLGGWKSKSASGYGYLSLIVDTWKPDFIKKEQSAETHSGLDDDVPF